MLDLWIAIGAMLFVAALIGLTTAWCSPRGRQSQMLVIGLALAGSFTFLMYSAGQLYWARLIPNAAVIVWSNFLPWSASIAAAVCWRLADIPRWRRLFMTMTLGSIVIVSAFWPFLNIALRQQPDGGNDWNGPVAMQTSWATCSPAAAATFLTASGMPISEREMIPRCLTDAAGTPTLGLYRGVQLVAQDHDRRAEVGDFSLDQLLSGDITFPVLLMVRLPKTGVNDPRYAQQWGWIPGMGHSVVVIGLTDESANGLALDGKSERRLVIADPAKGVETWTRGDMEVLWHGNAIIVK